MGLPLIASSLAEAGSVVAGVLMAAAGLGFIIFVHELGHFAVARMCGVKCDKFMVGFDFWGLKLSRKWGETEYGIGVFPLGGYVKMMGQDDDPSKAAEQFEEGRVEEGSEHAKLVKAPDGTEKYIDRRSYQAKSVLQRMAIISAGVVMNVIFAFVFAFFAYGMGVEYPPCVISQTSPGAPAWQAGLTTGDEIIQIGDRTAPSFEHLSVDVSLADVGAGVDFHVQRASTGEVEVINLKPRKLDGKPKIGVGPPTSLDFYKKKSAYTAASKEFMLPPVAPGARIAAVDGQAVESYRQLVGLLVNRPGDEVTLELAPASYNKDKQPAEPTLVLKPMRAKTLGLSMKMGPVTAVQSGSPAESAGVQPGDLITALDGNAIGPGAIAPEDLDLAVADDASVVELTVSRGEDELRIPIEPRKVTWFEHALGGDSPQPVAALGLTYKLEPVVDAVAAGGPAEAAGLKTGDRVLAYRLDRPTDEEGKVDEGKLRELEDGKRTWAGASGSIARLPDGSRVYLKVERGDEQVEVTVTPEASSTRFLPDRGLSVALASLTRKREVTSYGEQASYALDRTWFSLTMVVRVLQKLVTRQVDADNLGGPLMILGSSYQIASADTAQFLLFLTLISANLAVLNFLPIPVLDGGHMVFLAYEGITGRPANEKLMIVLQMIGVVLLLSLMLFVTYNDIMRFFGS